MGRERVLQLRPRGDVPIAYPAPRPRGRDETCRAEPRPELRNHDARVRRVGRGDSLRFRDEVTSPTRTDHLNGCSTRPAIGVGGSFTSPTSGGLGSDLRHRLWGLLLQNGASCPC